TFTTAVGSMSYLATYSGDSTYVGATADCEPLTVSQISSKTATQIHNGNHDDITNTSVPLGTVVHDKATVTGTGPTPTGSVTFKRFTNGTCYGTPAASETVGLVGGSAESSTFTTVVGSMSYLVSYSGDTNYLTSTADCEPLKVALIKSST